MGLRISVTNTSTNSLVFTRIFDSDERSRGLTIGGALRDDVPLRGQAPGAFEVGTRSGRTVLRFNMGVPRKSRRLREIDGDPAHCVVRDGAWFETACYRVHFEAEPSTGLPVKGEAQRVKSTPEPAMSCSAEFEVIDI